MSARLLDVRPEDLNAATAALQQLALALFEELFADGERLSAERWFALPEARVLDRIPFTRLGWRRLVARAAPFLKDKVTGRKRWVHASSSRVRWSDGAIRARLALDAHGAEGWLIPDRLLGVVARAAWEDLAFRVQASTLVLDHFRSRLIAPGEGFATPRIAPGLIWMIVAVARVTPPALVRLGLAHRAQRRALARLQRFAQEVLDESSLPDDFWSHWITWHAERRYGQRSELSPRWHSRLSAADRLDEIANRRRGDPLELALSPSTDARGFLSGVEGSERARVGGPSQSWTTPEAIAAAYAAWYPINRSEDVPLESRS